MRRIAVVLAIAGLLVHFFLTLALGLSIRSEAGAFAREYPEGGGVTSYDELPKLGWSPLFGLLGLAITGLTDALVTGLLLTFRRTRAWAWIVPIVTSGISVLVCVAAIAGFQPPSPQIGG